MMKKTLSLIHHSKQTIYTVTEYRSNFHKNSPLHSPMNVCISQKSWPSFRFLFLLSHNFNEQHLWEVLPLIWSDWPSSDLFDSTRFLQRYIINIRSSYRVMFWPMFQWADGFGFLLQDWSDFPETWWKGVVGNLIGKNIHLL